MSLTTKPTNVPTPELAPEDTTTLAAMRPPLKLLVPTLVLIVFWVVTETSYRLEMGMFYRFITRMIAMLLLFLFFLIWGFTRRHYSFGQRLAAFLIIMGSMFLAGAVGDATTGIPATAMMGLPIVLTASIASLWFTRRRGVRLEFTGIGLASVLVFGTISLLRWDGMDGRQRAQLSWRWTPSREERFLQQSSQAGVASAADRPALPEAVLEETDADWNSFRGGRREGEVRGVQFADWNQTPPREIWRRRVGPAWSSVIAIGDCLFTQEQRDKREATVCYDAATGHEVWVHTSDAAERFEEPLSGTGPRATPTFHDNRIYAYGAKGHLDCLNAVTGKPQWGKSLFEITGAKVPQWGSATSPTIVDDLVLVFVGGKEGNSLLALGRITGEQRWQAPGGTTSYSSPQVMTLAGTRQIIMHDDLGLNGLQIEDGKVLWSHPSPNAGSFQPMLQPHLIGQDQLLVNWDAGLLCLKFQNTDGKWQIDPVWTSNRMKPSFNEFAIHKGYIYGLDDGILACADLQKGQRTWKRGRYGFGQMLLLPDLDELLVLTEQGDVVRVAADPKEHREIGRFKAIEGKTWNHPLLAHGRLIVRNSEEMACFEITPTVSTAQSD